MKGLGKVRGHTSPGDHFLLLVGGVATTAQHFGRCGQEVEKVVGEVLVDQREQNLDRKGNVVGEGYRDSSRTQCLQFLSPPLTLA